MSIRDSRECCARSGQCIIRRHCWLNALSELARRLDRAHSYIGRIESGDLRLDIPEFIQWCEVLGAGPVEVMQRIMRR